MNTQAKSPEHKVVITSAPSRVLVKPGNGAEYVILTARFVGKIDPKTNEELLHGCAFTIKNKDGKIKPVPAVGSKLTAYQSTLINPETGEKKFLFELGAGMIENASQETMEALFGAEVEAGQTV